jgi:adenylate cyclase
MNPLSKQAIKSQITGALISGALTALFMYVLFFREYRSIVTGACIGIFVYFGISFYSNKIEKRFLRKTNLFIVLVINSLVQILIILVTAWVFVGIFYVGGDFNKMFRNFSNLLSNYFFIGIVFGLVLSIFFNFYSIVTTLIGKNILGKLFLGMYRNPIETDRVFMFLDIASSTSIAEKTGHLKFLSLVNDFFTDIAEPIRQTKGEIYKYVGDEVIVTWKTKDAIQNANCIRCFLLIDELMLKRSEYYLNKYNIVPGYKAGMHGGLAITGELGYTKREIAYMGDVLNTTARIEESCKTFGKRFLISDEIMQQLELPTRITAEEVGMVKLRGKTNEMRLFSIEQTGQ